MRTPESLRDAMARTALADLALAVACAEGVAGAWETLVARLSPRLAGLARKHGVAEAEVGRPREPAAASPTSARRPVRRKNRAPVRHRPLTATGND